MTERLRCVHSSHVCGKESSIFGFERSAASRNVVALEWKEAAYSVRWEEFVAHGASVTCLALGRKCGRVMATGGEDKKVNLWTIGKPHCAMSLSGHTTAIECVKFGHHEDMICAGSNGGVLKIWNLEAAKLIRTLTGHKNAIKCADFHPQGDFLATGSDDSSIKLWDVRRKGSVFTYNGHKKTVKCLKFSPDGRWVASGGDESVLKLWDLAAGKLIYEFEGHTSSITDVEFHPNEFLLASGSSDGTVKFWDLESYEMVSSTEMEPGPIRCILFNSDGQCLFTGSEDLLKVYGWEPASTYDTLVMGWGTVFDLTACDNQLIAGTFCSTNVSVYVVDLKHVNLVASVTDTNGSAYIAQTPQKECEEYEEFFCPSRTYMLSCPSSPLKAQILNNGTTTFLPPLSTPQNQRKFIEKKLNSNPNDMPAILVHPMNMTYTKASDILHGAVLSCAPSSMDNPAKTMEKLAAGTRCSLSTDCIPTACRMQQSAPLMTSKDLEHEVMFPQLQKSDLDYLGFLPDHRSKSSGIDFDDFLPRYLQESLYLGLQSPPEMSDAEVMSSIFRGHESMRMVLSHRRKNLLIIIELCRRKGLKVSIEAALHTKDRAILVDILSIVAVKPSAWTLDMCQILLPSIFDLLHSKYESHVSVGCLSLKLIIKNFAPLIKMNILAPKSFGVDISREERYKKCMSCLNQLMSIRSSLLRRQSLQGKLGHSFRELHHLLQSLE